MPEYEIVHHDPTWGQEWWSVVEYQLVNGERICRGGDRHWLRREYAERALAFYERGGSHPASPILVGF